MKRRGVGIFAVATFIAAVVACRKPISDGGQRDCDGTPPSCYQPTVDGCCAADPIPAECGPRDAPVGTHLKWVCPDRSMAKEDCRGVGAACTPKPAEKPAEVRAPHAAVELEVWNPDASGSAATDAGKDAGKPGGRNRGGRRGR